MEAAAEGRSAGRPARLSREGIVEAVSRSENIDTITMRELAQRLGVSHASLYRWVPNRHALLELVSEVSLGKVLDGDRPLPLDRAPRLQALALRMRDRYLEIPGFATHLATPHPHHAPSIARLRAVVVDAFLAGGASPAAAEESAQAYLAAVVAWIALEDDPAAQQDEPRFRRFVEALVRGLPVTG